LIDYSVIIPLIKNDILYEDSNYIIFKRNNYLTNYNLIKICDCKWCTLDETSWNNIIEKGKLYGLINKQNNMLYSVLILHDGSIRRFIDYNHINIVDKKLERIILNIIS